MRHSQSPKANGLGRLKPQSSSYRLTSAADQYLDAGGKAYLDLRRERQWEEIKGRESERRLQRPSTIEPRRKD